MEKCRFNDHSVGYMVLCGGEGDGKVGVQTRRPGFQLLRLEQGAQQRTCYFFQCVLRVVIPPPSSPACGIQQDDI